MPTSSTRSPHLINRAVLHFGDANHSSRMTYPKTPDGRYFVVKGRLWRCTNPNLPQDVRQRLVKDLMDARRNIKTLMKTGDTIKLAKAREKVQSAKEGLGERGKVWWETKEGEAPADYNRFLANNTPYRQWYQGETTLPVRKASALKRKAESVTPEESELQRGKREVMDTPERATGRYHLRKRTA